MPSEVSNRTEPLGVAPSPWATVAVRVAGVLVPYGWLVAEAASVVVVVTTAETVTGTVVVVPVWAPVTVRCCTPAGTVDGRTTLTLAVPYSSVIAVPRVLSTANVPSWVSPRLTLTELSLTSAAVLKASDDRSKLTFSPGKYDAGAPAGNRTPTARWVKSGDTVPRSAMKSTMACRSVCPVSFLLVPRANAPKLSPPLARNELTVTE